MMSKNFIEIATWYQLKNNFSCSHIRKKQQQMCSDEKPPMHLQTTPNSPDTRTKTELGVSNRGGWDTSRDQKKKKTKSCSKENMRDKSHAVKIPSKPNGKHYGAKSSVYMLPCHKYFLFSGPDWLDSSCINCHVLTPHQVFCTFD